MRNKINFFFSLLIVLAIVAHPPLKAQDVAQVKDAITIQCPKGIVRTIKQDRGGNIWITSWEGVFKYDGKGFTNVTRNASSARFFSVLEDRKGNFWFASIGAGVYYYDGKTFKNFTTKDGLAANQVTNIFEDKAGIIWFGTDGGASRYDGKNFKNFKMSKGAPVTQSDSINSSVYDQPLPENSWMHNDVNAIIEDKAGKFWFGTRGNAFIYDGKTFTTITNKDGKPFTNVRSIIKDRKGNIWLGGRNGLWRYDGDTFTNFTRKFVGYIYEDKKGNIWTSSESNNDQGLAVSPFNVKPLSKDNNKGWALSRYDEKSLSDKNPTVTEIAHKPMIFGILEDDKANIWFGALDGVYRYDGKTITGFNSK